MIPSNALKSQSCEQRSKVIYDNFKTSSQPRCWYQHNIDQVVYSTSFRKLQKKYQLLSEQDPRCRTRMVHTLEVNRIAKELGQKLYLNSDLIECIALAHDLANSAYGSVSNSFLLKASDETFTHEEAGELMVRYAARKVIPYGSELEEAKKLIGKTRRRVYRLDVPKYRDLFPHGIEVYKDYDGNICYTCMCDEILDGIKFHRHMNKSSSLEAQVVSYADNIAYISQDIDDLISTGLWKENDKKGFRDLMKKLRSKHPSFSDSDMTKYSSIFSQSESERMGSLIKLFIDGNTDIVQNDTIQSRHSDVLDRDIFELHMNDILSDSINLCWEFLEQYYQSDRISNATRINLCRLEILWDILNCNDFTGENTSYQKFIARYESPIFIDFFNQKDMKSETTELWKKAYFISSLSGDEISLIINQYQQRDCSFELEIG